MLKGMAGEAIPADWNIFLNGYDSTDEKNPASSVVGIHHPAGVASSLFLSLNRGRVEQEDFLLRQPCCCGEVGEQHKGKSLEDQRYASLVSNGCFTKWMQDGLLPRLRVEARALLCSTTLPAESLGSFTEVCVWWERLFSPYFFCQYPSFSLLP